MKKHIAILVFPEFQILDLVATTIFEVANAQPGGPYYDVRLLSEHGGMVRSSSGVPVGTEAFGEHEIDTVMVAGAMDLVTSTEGFVSFLRKASAAARRTASICTGAFLLAEAGLLDGRRVTTHWCQARELQHMYPKARIEEDRIYIHDGNIWSSAGMTACIDLCLALVELEPKSDRIQQALTYAKSNLRKPLSVDELADAANLSRRQFSRSFRIETGQSPARAVESLRVEAARAMIESGNHPIDVVARENGFDDPERMRRAFIRAFGLPPQAIKRAARLEQAA